MKNFKGLLMFTLSLLLFLVACGDGNENESDTISSDSSEASASSSEEGQSAEEEISFPEKEITILYHSRAGSGGDLFLRNTAKPLEEILGVPIVVENRTGAGGANAWQYTLNSDPDGYTLVGTTATLISSPIMSDMDISYQDFTPLAQVFTDPAFIYVKGDSPFDSIEELIEYEQNNPGDLDWASSTPGSKDNITLAMIYDEANIDPSTVAFEGGSEGLVNIVGGHVDVGLGEYSQLRGQLEAGEVKILASLTEERHPQLEDIPTMIESGWDVVPYSPRAIMAPPDLPEGVQQVLIDAIEQVYDDPDFQETWEEEGLVPHFAPGQELMDIYSDMDDFVRPLLQ
ncbi:tripartite tricarboxylate transporter substrate binding protein [Alteribacter populi]|uniref:tripartite tricarboxylate transporter substrate binding protein n=1 Tax=Alteribacter populi TaxID=2011011 RepID=UPI000BBAFB1E|nr:tripartite tricarboxylate transporter substrate binding protein [Alteribacter populi]